MSEKQIGRPKKEVDEDMVFNLASIMCTHGEMALVLGVSPDTLQRRYADAIERGYATAKVSLRRMQLKSATSGNVAMQIWLGKQYLGQSEKVQEIYDPESKRIIDLFKRAKQIPMTQVLELLKRQLGSHDESPEPKQLESPLGSSGSSPF